jgi:hypothetical protein
MNAGSMTGYVLVRLAHLTHRCPVTDDGSGLSAGPRSPRLPVFRRLPSIA